MSNQNRFLLPHQPTAAGSSTSYDSSLGKISPDSAAAIAAVLSQENEYQVDTDFDSYWEEEARNPHRNRIRIGRQYQATVPPLLKQGERDQRKLEDLETLSFCPKRSAKVSSGELDNYFAVAKSLNLFASLVETRSLLGRDVTIADLNRIRHREGLSLASVIQPPSRQQQSSNSNVSPQSAQQLNNPTAASSPQKSPSSQTDNNNATTSATSPSEPAASTSQTESQAPLNKPLMKALSHFISLHHPCYHNDDCKKLQKDIPLDDDSVPVVNLRATSASVCGQSKEFKSSRSRSRQQAARAEEIDTKDSTSTSEQEQHPGNGDTSSSVQSQSTSSYEDWTREEIELLSKAIEVCGKKFGSIKKEFLPSKSVRSIVEYYYVGSRDVSDTRKKSNQTVDTSDGCSNVEKTQAGDNSQGGGGNGGSVGGDSSLSSSKTANNPSPPEQQNRSNSNGGSGGSSSTNHGSNGSSSSSSSSNSNSNNNSNSNSNSNNNNNNGNNNNNDTRATLPDASDTQVDKASLLNHNLVTSRNNSKQNKSSIQATSNNSNIKPKSGSKNIDARMSVYNFDDEIKDEGNDINISPPLRFDGPRAGAEVRPLKAKPILPNAPTDGDAGNSNVGSLKFFMDGQLVLKLNACQEQQEGGDKCHWVQSGEKIPAPSRQKRYSKRSNSDHQRQSSDLSQNGSQSNSVVSSQHDEDSTKTNEDLTDGEDSKESANSFAPRQKSFSSSPTPKRLRQNTKTEFGGNCMSPVQSQPILPLDYKRLAMNNRMKENTTHLNSSLSPQPQLVNQAAAAAAMPWLQANSFAMAAALLQGLPFPGAAGSLVNAQMQSNLNVPNSTIINNIINNNNSGNNSGNNSNNNHIVNLASSKPMDLSVEHQAPKPIQTTAKSRSRSKQKNN